MQLEQFIGNLKGFKPAINDELAIVLDQHLKPVVELTKERIAAGVDTENKQLAYSKPRKSKLNASGAYTNQYSNKRLKKGRQVEHVDLEYTGSYVNQIQAQRDGKKIAVESGDGDQTKTEALNENYPNHMGLSETQQGEILENITREIGERSIEILRK